MLLNTFYKLYHYQNNPWYFAVNFNYNELKLNYVSSNWKGKLYTYTVKW